MNSTQSGELSFPFSRSRDLLDVPVVVSRIFLEEGGVMVALLLPGFHLTVSIYDEDYVCVRSFQSQAFGIAVPENQDYIFTSLFVGWYKDNSFRAFFGDVQLSSRTDSSELLVVYSDIVSLPSQSSLWNDLAHECCEAKVKSRDDFFSKFSPRQKFRVAKSEAEIEASLKNGILRLAQMCEMVRKGDRKWFGTIMSELRGLLYYEPPKNNYCPALLQVAQLRKKPLPVYIAEPAKIDIRFANQDFRFHIGSPPKIFPEPGIAKLVDIEEWLDGEILRTFNSKPLSAAMLISECANTFGPVHYDPQTPTGVHDLNNMIQENEYLEDFFVELGESVVELGRWLFL